MQIKYTIQQKELLDHVAEKVKKLFKENPVPAHGVDHISRVVAWAKEIIKGEKVISPLLCELSAWTHDVGRVREDNPGESTRKHHELSYMMLQEWFKADKKFDILSKKEKLELLYAVRYHWNDAAVKYDTAWILRDADKLDGYGKVGLKRAWGFFKGDDEGWNQNFRNLYDSFYHVRTKTAKNIIKKNHLIEEVDLVHEKYLKSKIKKVEL